MAKKVVHVKSDSASEPTWTPTPEAKGKATRNRIIAVVLWLLAIGGEAVTIFWLLKLKSVGTTEMIVLVVAIVVIAVLAIGGSLLWKQANRLDPARRSEPIRFFIQNQLGAIIAMVAFLPLIIVILLDKNMSGKEKGVAEAVAVVALVVSVAAGVTLNPPSVEQYTAETNRVVQLTGHNDVFWTKDGTVYHLCHDASAVNRTSQDNTIYDGTVAQAHAAGMQRLTLQVEQELEQCGLPTLPPSAG